MALDNIFITRLDLGDGGPRIAVKDCIDIAGLPTCAGSEALADAPPARAHASVVASILTGGGRIVGKTNMHELAYGVTGVNRWLGTPANTNYPALIPGGSSSGSAAAVAAGLADIAIGTDTGGSIRMPAACCGVFGLKPTFGRVSRQGCSPSNSTLDCVGPLASDIAGLEAGMALIDPTFERAPPLHAARLGWVENDADPEIADAIRAVAHASGAEVLTADLHGLDAAFQAGITIMAAECWAAFRGLVGDPRMGEDVRARLLGASKVTVEAIRQAEAVRIQFRAGVDRALEMVDALILPTLPAVPPPLEDVGDAARMLRLTALVRPFNLSGHPALSIPIPGPGGGPAAIQLIGARGKDEHLCAVAALVEKGIAI